MPKDPAEAIAAGSEPVAERAGPGRTATARSGARRLRSHRLKVEDLNLRDVTVVADHPTVGTLRGSVADLSLHGMALLVLERPGDAPLVLAGDRLQRMSLLAGGRIIHEGPATVRRVAEQSEGLLLGLELEGPGLDLSEIYRHGARRSVADRWEKADQTARFQDISPSFKAWVASLATYLESVQAFLCGEERSIASEDLSTRSALEKEILGVVAPDLARAVCSAASELGSLVEDLSEEEHATHRAFCRAHLGSFFARSPFMRRAQEKPLGYAGDYEMMNMLYRDHAEGADLFGRAMNLYATGEAAARANINRIDFLGAKIEACVREGAGRRVRIASIGSGPGQEIHHLLATRPALGAFLDIALIDQEERAIAYCERSLSPLAQRTGAVLRVIPESVRRLLTGRALSSALGERDLIYSAGLFDYLSGRTFSALLATLYDALVPGGVLAVGNVAIGNPSRWAMEYFSEWFLIHRTSQDLTELGGGLEPRPSVVRVESEPLGVNLFLVVER
jgi:extracellular factor (EF) 3-hydroxypalmitic acid methyl ester biosynthesis protein